MKHDATANGEVISTMKIHSGVASHSKDLRDTDLASYRAKSAYKAPGVADGYDAERFTTTLGKLYNRLELRAFEIALRNVKPGSSVLDLACGTGRIAERLAAHQLNVFAADISFAMVEVARAKLGQTALLVNADAEALPFQDASFDWVVSDRLFGHVPPSARVRILAEVARVARCGAIVAFYLLNPATRARRFLKSFGHVDPHWYPATRPTVVRELAAQGLRAQDVYPVIPVIDQAHVFVATKR